MRRLYSENIVSLLRTSLYGAVIYECHLFIVSLLPVCDIVIFADDAGTIYRRA